MSLPITSEILESLIELTAIQAHNERCWNLSLHPTLPLLSSVSSDRTVNVYNTIAPATSNSNSNLENTPSEWPHLITTLKGTHKRSVRASQWKPTRSPVLASASFDGTVAIWRPEDEDIKMQQGEFTEWECVAQLEGHEHECKSVAWSSDGRYIGTCSRDKSVWVWEGEIFNK
jgi:cytosolic iron-sulfur protein assembly protein CIAO1